MSGFPRDMFYMANDDRFIIIMYHIAETDGTFGYFYSQHEEAKAIDHYQTILERNKAKNSKDMILYLSGCQVKEKPIPIDTSIISEYTKDKIASMGQEELEATIELCIQQKRKNLIDSWKKKDEEHERRFSPISIFEEPARKPNGVENTLKDFEGDILSVEKLPDMLSGPDMKLMGADYTITEQYYTCEDTVNANFDVDLIKEYLRLTEDEELKYSYYTCTMCEKRRNDSLKQKACKYKDFCDLTKQELLSTLDNLDPVRDNEVFLLWFDPNTGREFAVGVLTKGKIFEFNYLPEVRDAIANGFKLMPAFDKIKTMYESERMFPVFSSRLPDKNRPDISAILRKYNMEEYDEFELLRRGGANLPIDGLRFSRHK